MPNAKSLITVQYVLAFLAIQEIPLQDAILIHVSITVNILYKQYAYPKFVILAPISKPRPEIKNPCVPSPCGPNSQCSNIGDSAQCNCLPNFLGTPPNCRPECVINAECPSNMACMNEKCRDPCPGSCGLNALCLVRNHNAICTCPTNYAGNAFEACHLAHPVREYLYISIFRKQIESKKNLRIIL